jgi:hypothetical protein
MVRLAHALRAADPADDPDVILGIIAGLFEAHLPASVKAKKHEVVFRDNGLCHQSVLVVLTVDQLRSLGITMGEAMLVLSVLQEQTVAPPPMPGTPMMGASAAAPAEGDVVHYHGGQRRAVARQFPELGPTGFPLRGEWLASQVAFATGLGPTVPAATQQQLLGVNARPQEGLGAGYEAIRGDPGDQRVLNELVQSMPTALLNAVPTDCITTQSGLAVYAWITQSVMSASDESVSVMQQWFADQPALSSKKKSCLAQSLAEWRRVRDELANCGAPRCTV